MKALMREVEKVVLLADHQSSMTAMHLVTYVIFGVVLAVLSLALHRRMKDSVPVLMQVATAVGLVWAVVLMASSDTKVGIAAGCLPWRSCWL